MNGAGKERGKEIREQPTEDRERRENAKKMLNRGNKLEDLLKTQYLAVFSAKNKPKTNSILSAKSASQDEKRGLRGRVSGAK